jgi:hypothetical protein
MKKLSRRAELRKRWPKGCAPPTGYCDWSEWAEAQYLHGLKQGNCEDCGRYCFPQELNEHGTCLDGDDCGDFINKHGPLQLVQP